MTVYFHLVKAKQQEFDFLVNSYSVIDCIGIVLLSLRRDTISIRSGLRHIRSIVHFMFMLWIGV